MSRPFVITVSGSDASGGAGMQADSRAILAAGAFPLNVVTALTLQTGRGVESLELISPDLIRMHLLGLLKEYPVSVIKAGMLGQAGTVRVLVEVLEQYSDVKLVLDPVLKATSGRPLLDEEGLHLFKTDLLSKSYLLTPNLPELETLSSHSEFGSKEAESRAVSELLNRGCHAVLVKGGHRTDSGCMDRLYRKDEELEFFADRVESENTRGTGCGLASFIAGTLAAGTDLSSAVSQAKDALTGSLQRNSLDSWPSGGPGFL